MQVVKGVFPSISGVSVELPAVSLLGSCPVWHSEALEDGTGSAIEGYISNSFKNSVWMEVLSVDVVLNVRLLVELIAIEVLNSYSYIINILNKLGSNKVPISLAFSTWNL